MIKHRKIQTMSDNCGFGGAVGILVLLVALGAMGNNGNGGLFGGGNNNIPAQTSALVEQNNTARQVSANGAALTSLLERVGGNVEATVRGFDNVGNQVRDLDSKLCQLGNNIGMGQRDIIQAQKDCCCGLEKTIDRQGDRVLAWLNEDRDRKQLAEISDLKAERSNYKQTEELKAWARAEFGCCRQGCGGGAGVENGILANMMMQMQSLAASVATIASKMPTTTAGA